MEEIVEFCTERNPAIVLCGLKLDMEKEREVTDTEAIMFAARHKMYHCETSAKTGENVNLCFLQLGAQVGSQNYEMNTSHSWGN